MRRQQGFSLAEVVVALGILAGVLISVAGLLVLGGRIIGAGRSSTMVLSVANDMMEQVRGWGFDQTYVQFGCAPDEVSCSRDTNDDELEEWEVRLKDSVSAPYGQVLIEALDAASLEQARTLRVTVTISWRDGPRERRLRLVTVRT